MPKQYEHYGVLFNFYYDFKFDYFRPYLGFNIGAVSMPDKIYVVELKEKNSMMSAGGVTAGLSYPLNKQLELRLEYKMLYMYKEVQVTNDNNAKVTLDFYHHLFNIGLRYNFI